MELIKAVPGGIGFASGAYFFAVMLISSKKLALFWSF